MIPPLPSGVQHVVLRRDSPHDLWGFRLVGGAEHSKPLQIQRVTLGSASDGELQRGDTVLRLDGQDTANMTHQEAHDIISNSVNELQMTVNRTGYEFSGPSHVTQTSTLNRTSSFKRSPIMRRDLSRDWQEETESQEIRNQPYRTFPVITPSVKVKRDIPTGTWLREPRKSDYARKKDSSHKVEFAIDDHRTVTNKQFNSPIGLYSSDNLSGTIRQQTGYNAPSSALNRMRPTVQYDPAKSATFQAIQEMEHPGVREEKPATQKVYSAPSHAQPTWAAHPLGHAESIQQSGSFKRVMAQVLGDTEF